MCTPYVKKKKYYVDATMDNPLWNFPGVSFVITHLYYMYYKKLSLHMSLTLHISTIKMRNMLPI